MLLRGTELKRLVKKCEQVFGWVNMTPNEGSYIRLVKSHLLLNVISGETEYQIKTKELPTLDYTFDLYIN